MAKQTRSITFSGATLNKKDMTITEYAKESVMVTDINKLLDEWDGEEDLYIQIKKVSNSPISREDE